MAIGGMAAAFFLDKPPGAWTKIGIAIGGFVLGNRQQPLDLFAHNTGSAPLGQRAIPAARDSSRHASAFQQCAEFQLLRYRGFGPTERARRHTIR